MNSENEIFDRNLYTDKFMFNDYILYTRLLKMSLLVTYYIIYIFTNAPFKFLEDSLYKRNDYSICAGADTYNENSGWGLTDL